MTSIYIFTYKNNDYKSIVAWDMLYIIIFVVAFKGFPLDIY